MTNVTRRLHSAARWSHIVARFTVASSSSHTNSAERKSTCVRSVDTRLDVRNYTTLISNSSIHLVRRCCEHMTSVTSSSLDQHTAAVDRHCRRRWRAGTPRHRCQLTTYRPLQPQQSSRDTHVARAVRVTECTLDSVICCQCLITSHSAVFICWPVRAS